MTTSRRSDAPRPAQHAHTHEWGRFTVLARTHAEAAREAGRHGWWLHCWRWQESNVEAPEVVEHAPPAPHSTWEAYVHDQDERFERARANRFGGGA